MTSATPHPVGPGPNPPHDPRGAQAERDGRRWWRVLPVLTFLAGLLLGVAAVGVLEQATSDGPQRPSATPTPTPSERDPAADGGAGAVSEACLAAGEDASRVLDILRDAAQAVADLDARRLQRVLDEAERVQESVEASVARCRPGTEATGGQP